MSHHNQPPSTRRLFVSELADALRRHPSYVYAMRRRGFRMPGNTATLEEALAWLDRNGSPRSSDSER